MAAAALLIFLVAARARAQSAFSSVDHSGPRLGDSTDAAEHGEAPSGNASTPCEFGVSWRCFAPDVLGAQKRIWTFPATLSHGRSRLPTAGFILGTGGLMALDQYDAPYFRRTTRFHEFNHTFTDLDTAAAMAIVPGALYACGHFRHDASMEHAVQLVGEAVLDSEALNLVLRDATNRVPPIEIPANGNFADSFFDRHKGLLYFGPGGFTSGHMIAAVSIATIFAKRYRRHRWVPWLACGLARVGGFSRITRSDHFPSDVFAGAFLGYVISRYDVLRNREP